MVRIRGALAVVLAASLLASACGGMAQPLPPAPESPAENLSQTLPQEPEPAREESSQAPEESSGQALPPESESPLSPEPPPPETEADSSLPTLQPGEIPGPAESEPAAGQEPSSRPEEPPEESSSQPDEEPSLPPESQPEPSEPSEPSQPEQPEPLPQGCRWMNITEASLLGFINRERGKQGLAPLTLDADLTAAARVRAEELFRGNYVAHTRPGGEPWETVLGELCIDYARAAENLAWCNHGVGEEMGAFQWFSLWKDSPSHYQAMVDAQYTYCGVAVLTGPYYDGEDQSYAVAIFCTY